MAEPPFIHLAVRTSFSLLQSMIGTKDLTGWCVEHKMPAVAVTDHNNMFGALELSEALAEVGVQPIMAVCFDVTDGAHDETVTRLSLYAQNEVGYQRLTPYLARQGECCPRRTQNAGGGFLGAVLCRDYAPWDER